MLYKNEALNRVSDHAGADPQELKEKIRKKLKINYRIEFIKKAVSVVFGISVFILIGFLVSYALNYRLVKHKYPDKKALFKTLHNPKNKGIEVKVEYFIEGPKAAEISLKDGLKHQNSESFYESGQQFRSALYYYDTLVREIYFYKNGDTIRNFPGIHDLEVHHISIPPDAHYPSIELDFYDGKMITGSYVEHQK